MMIIIVMATVAAEVHTVVAADYVIANSETEQN